MDGLIMTLDQMPELPTQKLVQPVELVLSAQGMSPSSVQYADMPTQPLKAIKLKKKQKPLKLLIFCIFGLAFILTGTAASIYSFQWYQAQNATKKAGYYDQSVTKSPGANQYSYRIR